MSELPPLPPGGPEAPRLDDLAAQAEADRNHAAAHAQAEANRLRDIQRARAKASNDRSANKRAKRERAEAASQQAAARRAKRASDRQKRRAMRSSRAVARRARIQVGLVVLATLLAVVGLVVAGAMMGGPNNEPSVAGQALAQQPEEAEVEAAVEESTQAVDTSSELFGTQFIPVGFDRPVAVRMGGTHSSVWNISVSGPVRASNELHPDYRVDVVLRLESSDTSEPLALPGVEEPWLFRTDGGTWQPHSWVDSRCAPNGDFTELVRAKTLAVGDEYRGSLCSWQLSTFIDVRDVDVVLRTGIGEVVFSRDGNRGASQIIDRSIDSFDLVGYSYGRPVSVPAGNEAFPSIWNFSVGEPVALAAPDPQNQEDVVMSFRLDAQLVESYQATDGIFGDVFAIVGGPTGSVYPVELGHYPCGGRFHPPDNARSRVGYTSTTFGCATVSSRDALSAATFVTYADNPTAELVVFRGGGIDGTPSRVEEPETPLGFPFGSTFRFENSVRDEAGVWTVRSWRIEPSETPEWNEVTIVVGFRPAQDETVSVVVEPPVYILGGATRRVHRAPCDAAVNPEPLVVVGDEMHDLVWCVRVPVADSDHADTRVGLTVFQDDYVFDGPG